MSIRILVVDDHPIMRASVVTLLRAERDFDVVGEAADGEEAVTAGGKLKPDVVVLDVAMPKMNGIQAAGALHKAQPTVRILMLSMHSSPAHVEHALAAGAHGFLLKADAADEVVRAVREVFAGRRYFSRKLEPHK